MALTEFDLISKAMTKIDASEVQSYDAGTREAEVAEQLYNVTKQGALAIKQWNFNHKTAVLSQLIETPLDTTWTYAFDLPSDSLQIQRIIDEAGATVSHTIEDNKVYTNTNIVLAKYLADVSESEMPVNFINYLIALLAFQFASPINGSETLVQRLAKEVDATLRVASRADAWANPPEELYAAGSSTWVNVQNSSI